MNIKIYPKDLIVWRAYLLDSRARFWNPYNFSQLYGLDGTQVVADVTLVSRQLEIALNLLSSIFKKGGKSWFYNIFRHPKSFTLTNKFQYIEVKRSRILPFGLSLGSWFPGKLSNRKFLRLRSKIIRKRLFLHKLSAFKKFYRLYRPGGRRLSSKRRRRYYRKPRWATLQDNWRPKSRSRRKGFSSKHLINNIHSLLKKKLNISKPKFKRFRKYRNKKHLRFYSKKFKRFKRRFFFEKPKKNKLKKKKRIYKFKRKLVNRTCIMLLENFGFFFKRPNALRSFNIHTNFVPTEIPRLQLDKITPGTEENPTDLPIVKMPTTHVRRRIRKKKKMYKLLINPYDTPSGEDFSTITDILKPGSRISKRLESDITDYPTARFYRFLLYKPERVRIIKSISYYFGKYPAERFKRKFTRRRIRRFFRLRKRYIESYKYQRKIYRWFNRLLKLSDKSLRLAVGLPSLSFRSFFSDIGNFFALPFKKRVIRQFKNSVRKFFIKRKKYNRYSLIGVNKPFKKFLNLKSRAFLRRQRRKPLFRKRKIKAKTGLATPNEKLFKSLNKKVFKKNHYKNTFKRRALFDVVSGGLSLNNVKSFTFNVKYNTFQRKKRLSFHNYDVNRKFYSIKKKPIFSNFFTKLKKFKSATNLISNKKLKIKNKLVNKFVKKDNLLNNLKNQYNLLYNSFMYNKLISKVKRAQRTSKALNKGLKVKATPFRFYPTVMFAARLTRLTISIFNEARAAGVILVYLNSGEVSPQFNYYNIVISDREKFLLRLELIFKQTYAISRVSNIVGRYAARYNG